MSEDGARGPYSHFLVVPSPTYNPNARDGNAGRDNRLATMNLRGFQQPVPLFSIFRALGCTSDRDVYDTVLAGVPDRDRNAYDEVLYELLLSHDKFLTRTGKTDLDILAEFTRSKSRFEIVEVIHDRLFSHVEDVGDDVGGMLRRKSYVLGSMLKMALDIEIGRKESTDRDNLQNKRFKTSGVLMFEEFRRIFRENGKEMLLRMDKRHTYEAASFREKNLVNLVDPMTMGYIWRGWFLLAQTWEACSGARRICWGSCSRWHWTWTSNVGLALIVIISRTSGSRPREC